MIYPTDKNYPVDPKNPDDKRPVITTLDEYLGIALNAGLGAAMNLDKNGWNEQIQSRYDANKSIGFLNMRTFSKDLAGRTTNLHDIFELQNRLDDFIKLSDDPVNKTMAMAVRNISDPTFNRAVEDNLFTVCYNAMSYVQEDYIISKDVFEQIRAREREVSRNISGKQVNGEHADISSCDFDDLPSMEQLRLVSVFAKSFTDRKAMLGNTGKVITPTVANKQILEKVNAEAVRISDAGLKKKNSKYNASDERDKRDFKALASACKKMDKAGKQEYSQRISDFNSNNDFANMDISVKVDHLDLSLENNPIVTLSADEFIEKQKNNSLDNTETEWGEANIDSMLRGLYTDDEYKKLRRAGIDPAMGLMVDGKPLDWFKVTEYGASYDKQDTLTRARQKCNVLAKALNGSKIDAFKFVPDGKGGLKKGKLYPVKTNLEMKTDQPQKRSIWEWIKKFFGFSVKPTIKEKIQKANEEPRDYLSYFDPDKKSQGLFPQEAVNLLSEAKRDELSTKLKVNIDRNARNLNVFDKEFFGDVFDKYPNGDMNDEFNFSFDNINDNEMSKEQRLQKKVDSAFSFIDYNEYDKKNEAERAEAKKNVPGSTDIVSTMDRQGSRVNMAILYGMTMGYTYDEMTDTSLKGKERRQEVGEYFIKEFATMDYDKFMQSKNLQDNDKTREAYLNYTLGKKEKLELFSLRALEAIEREPIIRPNPTDYNEVVGQITKMNGFFNMAHDFIQSIQPLSANKIAPTNTKANILTDRSSTIRDYINSKLYPVSSMAFCTKKFSDALASDTFVRTSDTVDDPYTVTWAAQSKAALIYYYDQTVDLKNYGDIMNDAKLNSYLSAIVFESRSDDFTEKQAETYLKYDLQSPLANNILIYDREGKIMKKDQKIEDFTTSITNAAT
ncbi:MAG: hypothetical protein ACI3XQ_07535, partial [Eubacteriales bacterium]